MTLKKDRQPEDEGFSKKKVKHARNPKGQGMKVLNSYAEEYYDDEDLDYDFESYYEDENTKTH